MRLLILYIVASCVFGVLLRRRPGHTRIGVLIGMSLLVCVGYYFLNQV